MIKNDTWTFYKSYGANPESSVSFVDLESLAGKASAIGHACNAFLVTLALPIAAKAPRIFDKSWQAPSDLDFLRTSPLALVSGFCALLLLAHIVNTFLRGFRRHQQHLALEKRYGCAPPPAVPNPFPWGLRHKFNLLTAQGGDLLDSFFRTKYQKYGSTHALFDSFGTPKVIHTVDPVIFNTVLSTSFDDWRPSKSRTNTVYPLAQDGLLTTEGEKWHKNRKLIQRHIGGRRVRDVCSAEDDIKLLFQAIGEPGADGWSQELDLLELFHRLALDLSTSYLLGMSANMQTNGMVTSGVAGDSPSPSIQHAFMSWLGLTPLTYAESYEVVRNHFSWRSKLGSKYWLADSLQVSPEFMPIK